MLTRRERNLGLVRVEGIKAGIQRIGKTVHFTGWVQLSPGVSTCIAFAGLEHEHQCVQPRYYLWELAICDLVVGVFGWMCA